MRYKVRKKPRTKIGRQVTNIRLDDHLIEMAKILFQLGIEQRLGNIKCQDGHIITPTTDIGVEFNEDLSKLIKPRGIHGARLKAFQGLK